MQTFTKFITEETSDGAAAYSDAPLGGKRRQFDVPPSTFKNFEKGRMKFERWNKFLDMEDPKQVEIHEFVKKNRKHVVLLKCSESGAMRSIRPRSKNGS